MTKRTYILNKHFLIVLQVLCLLLILSCKAQPPVASGGLVIVQSAFYRPETKSFVRSETDWPDIRTWYKDSMVIEGFSKIMGHTSADGNYRRWIEPNGYTFIDLCTKSFYHYKTFTDTAKLVAKWEQNDSAAFYKYGGIWRFYNEKSPRTMTPVREPTPLADTLIGGVLYKRLTFPIANGRGGEAWRTAYFRCDKKETMFRFEKVLSKRVGCPMTRFEGPPEGETQFALSDEIKFVREHLTAEEMKVFAAWEKNAKENPVQ